VSNIELAKAELRKLGIVRPDGALIENWLRAASASAYMDEAPHGVEVIAEPYAVSVPTSETASAPRTSKSRLEPVLRDSGTLERPAGPRKPGRPRIVASWFPKVAETMVDGTSLKMALAINGISLSKSEVRACYRNRTFQGLYQDARRKFLAEHYGRKPTLRAVIGRYM
jgi:hypothetical protein